MSTEPKVVGYCRACGKALDESTVRTASGTIYCEEHLPVTTTASTIRTATPPPITEPSPYTAPAYATTPPPVPHSTVSPGVAFVLGFIPGVGAIYNGQYAKGFVHVIIFGLMISVLDNNAAHGLEPLLGMLLAGFIFYMPFEAYHTARKRQLGMPVDEFSSIVPTRTGSRFPVAPVILIALGVIFLLSNLDLLDFSRVLRYWPIALIALGAYMLYARMAGPAPTDDHEVRR
jgi:hypothetical protein